VSSIIPVLWILFAFVRVIRGQFLDPESMMASAPAATAAMAAGTGRDARRGLAGLENPVAAENDPPDRLAGFRVLGESVVLHALLDLEVADFPPLFCGNGLVNVSRHGPENLCLLMRVRQQVGFPFLVCGHWWIQKQNFFSSINRRGSS
jgi:hypothetical protein